MYRQGHYGVALLAFAPLAFVLLEAGAIRAAAVLGGVVLWLSMVPDLDRSLPLVRHRGPTHSLAFAALVGVAMAGAAVLVGTIVGAGPGSVAPLRPRVPWVEPTGVAHALQRVPGADGAPRPDLAFAGFVVGALAVVSHLVADLLTPVGVAPLWPLSSRRASLNLAPASDAAWNAGLLSLGLLATAVAVVLAGRTGV